MKHAYIRLINRLTRTKRSSALRRVCNCGLAGGALAAILTLSASAHAAGLLTPADGSATLELTEQHVSVIVENGFSVTEVNQVFSNPHTADKQAIYSFPVPENAAVGEFTYWIDGNPVHAEVLEKQAARDLHEQQKQQGRDSALVEQNSYKTFEVEVSPVRANQAVTTRLVYLQQNRVDHSIGRYVYPLEDGGVESEAASFWTRNETVSKAFSFKLRLRSAYPVDAMRVTNGTANVQQLDSGEWELTIESNTGTDTQIGAGMNDEEIEDRFEATEAFELVGSERQQAAQPNRSSTGAYSLNRDIVVYWRLADNLPGSIDLVTYKEAGSNSGTFMLTLTPGIDLAPITEGRDWVFVLDTSGSMEGKFDTLIESVKSALVALNPVDRFKVILFNDHAQSLSSDMQPASQQAVAATLQQLDSVHVNGSTNLYDGLQKAVKSLDNDRTSAIVLVTDGVANVGETEMTYFLKLLDKVDVRLFTAVMGNSANRPLLEGLAKHAEGIAVNVSNDDDMLGLMLQMVSKVTHQAMHKIRVSIDGVRTRNLTPDRFSRVYRGEQLVLMGKYSGSGKAKVTLKAEISGQPVSYVSDLVFPNEAADNPELERLWAFASIQALQEKQNIVGETEDSRQGITDIALQHGLVTDYTSLIVVNEDVFEAEGIDRNNASRVERERVARTARSQQEIAQTRQDTLAPAFQSNRATSSNGGGSFGAWLLTLLGILLLVRIGLGLKDKWLTDGQSSSSLSGTIVKKTD